MQRVYAEDQFNIAHEWNQLTQQVSTVMKTIQQTVREHIQQHHNETLQPNTRTTQQLTNDVDVFLNHQHNQYLIIGATVYYDGHVSMDYHYVNNVTDYQKHVANTNYPYLFLYKIEPCSTENIHINSITYTELEQQMQDCA